MKAGRLITLRRDAYAGHTALAPASEQIWIAEIRFRQRNLVTKQSFVTSQEEINPKPRHLLISQTHQNPKNIHTNASWMRHQRRVQRRHAPPGYTSSVKRKNQAIAPRAAHSIRRSAILVYQVVYKHGQPKRSQGSLGEAQGHPLVRKETPESTSNACALRGNGCGAV